MNYGLQVMGRTKHRASAPSVTLLAHTGVNDNGAGTSVTTPGIDTTGASLLVAIISVYPNSGAYTYSDSKGNTWVAQPRCTGNIGLPVILYSGSSNLISVGAGHTFTAHDSSSSGTAVVFLAFSGIEIATDPAVAETISQQYLSSTTTIQATNVPITPDNNDLVVIGVGCYAGFAPSTTAAIDSSFTIPDTLAAAGSGPSISLWGAWRVSDGSAINPTWTLGATKNPGAVISAFAHA